MTKFVVIGLDMGAALKIGEALGYDRAGLAELLSCCESGMTTAINEKLSQGSK